MRHMNKSLATGFVLGLLLIAGFPLPSAAAPLPIMTASPSVRAVGLGYAGGAITDPFVSFLNPGGLGVYALSARCGVAHSSNDGSFNRVDNTTFLTLGMPLWDFDGNGRYPRVAAGFAYHRRRAGVKDVLLTDGTTQSFIDRLTEYSLGAAVEYGAAIGAGMTWKNAYNSVSETSVDCHDVGVYVEVPILRTLTRTGVLDRIPELNVFTPEITTTVSYTWANRAGDAQNSICCAEVPRNKLFARSAVAGLRYHDARVAAFLLTRDDRLDELADQEARRQGWELDLLGIVQVRGGSHWTGSQDNKTTTSGLSLYLHGLTQWIDILRTRAGHPDLPWYVRGLDLTYHTASWRSSLIGKSTADEFGFYFDVGALLDR